MSSSNPPTPDYTGVFAIGVDIYGTSLLKMGGDREAAGYPMFLFQPDTCHVCEGQKHGCASYYTDAVLLSDILPDLQP